MRGTDAYEGQEFVAVARIGFREHAAVGESHST